MIAKLIWKIGLVFVHPGLDNKHFEQKRFYCELLWKLVFSSRSLFHF